MQPYPDSYQQDFPTFFLFGYGRFTEGPVYMSDIWYQLDRLGHISTSCARHAHFLTRLCKLYADAVPVSDCVCACCKSTCTDAQRYARYSPERLRGRSSAVPEPWACTRATLTSCKQARVCCCLQDRDHTQSRWPRGRHQPLLHCIGSSITDCSSHN